MNKTKIEWCDYSLNLLTGCLNHVSGLCKGGNFPCYAYKLAHGRLKQRYLANREVAPTVKIEYGTTYRMAMGLGQGKTRILLREDVLNDPFYPRLWPDRFTVRGIPKGSRIFLNDMSDWVGIGIPEEWTRKILDFIRANPDYTFLTLTKQSQNLPKFSPFPENCWVGVTATNRERWFDAIWEFQDVKAKVKFISIEPLLDWHHNYPIDFHSQLVVDWFNRSNIDWPIIGEVDITACFHISQVGYPATKSPWFTGPYGLVLKNAILYEHPIPYKGKLGFFEVELPVAKTKSKP